MSETRTASIRGPGNLPEGEYGFLEFFCDDPACDCRRVIINVLSNKTGPKIWATINYGWESKEFYEVWMRGDKEAARECMGASLDPFNPQTEYSPALFVLFSTFLQDKAYVERLKRHYTLFKSQGTKNKTTVSLKSKRKR